MTVVEPLLHDLPTHGPRSLRHVVAGHLDVLDELLDDVPLTTARFPLWRTISVQAGLDAYLADDPTATLHGVPLSGFVIPAFAELLLTPGLSLGPIDYASRPTGPDTKLACIHAGLMLATWEGSPIAVWIHEVREDLMDPPRDLAVSVKCDSAEAAHAFLARLRDGMDTHNPYKGKSLKLVLDRAGNISDIHFEARPQITRDRVIMRDGVLEAIELHAVGVGAHAARLRKAGRHLKRGLLLYGPPGTGKTHTIRYLASSMPDSTLFVLTGNSMRQVKVISGLLTELSPAIVVLDDIDLIAEDRDSAGNAGSLLFNLLDAMDGIREDVDVLFICTTNRADSLEAAIAARPGRIDQAIEVDVPNASCRESLLRLYSQGIDLQVPDLASTVARTAGVTASFMKELVRRAALLGLDDDVNTSGPIRVTQEHLDAALDILLDPSKPLTKSLLGIHEPPDHDGLQREKTRGSGDAWCGI